MFDLPCWGRNTPSAHFFRSTQWGSLFYSEEIMYYIYGLYEPLTNELRYIGATNNPQERFASHLKSKPGTHNRNWLCSLREKKLKPTFKIIEQVDDDSWSEREQYWIAHYKSAGARLTNATKGGEGTTGLRHSEKTLKQMSEAKKGAKNSNFGKHLSEKVIDAIRKANTGRHPSLETRLKLSRSRQGKHRSEECKRKISDSHKGERNPMFGKHFSKESSNKLSQAMKGERNPFFGKKHSEETRKKMSLARILHYEISKSLRQILEN
jgi:hypothetical protein